MPSRFLTRSIPALRALSAAARPILMVLACVLALALPSGAAFAAEGVNVKHGKTVVVEGGTFAFGTTDVGSKQVRNFSVTNLGGSAIDMASLGVIGAGFSARSESAVIYPGKKGTVIVELDTASAGNPMATINIPALGADPFEFKVTASVVNPSPRLLVSSQGGTVDNGGSVFIGSTIVGKPKSRSVTIRNTGALTLELGDPVLDGAGFTVTGKPKKTLGPGKSTRMNIRLDALETGSPTGAVTFTTNDPSNAQFKFFVDGSVGATGPDIAVNVPDRQVPNNGAVNFGNVLAGIDKVIPIRIRNVGNATLLLGQIESSSPVAFSVDVAPDATLAPGKSSILYLTFHSSQGAATGALSIASNDPDESPFVINLSAQGEPSPDVEVYIENGDADLFINDNADIVPYQVETQQTIVMPFQIRNAGTATLTFGAVQVVPVGGGPIQFFVSQQPLVMSLDPGAETTFSITFTDLTNAEAIHRADVSFSTNDPNEGVFNFRLGVAVILSASAPRPALGAASLLIDSDGRIVRSGGVFDFGAAYKGRPDTREFTVSNMGTAPLTLGPASLKGKGFTLVSQSDVGTPIPAGGSTSFTVRMNADQVGPVAASITLTTASGELITFLLSGKVE